MFVGKLHAKVIRVDAADQFLGQLAGVNEPEAKRKIIGREFVEVFCQRVQVFSVTHFLLFLCHFEGADVLLELALVYAVVVFCVF